LDILEGLRDKLSAPSTHAVVGCLQEAQSSQRGILKDPLAVREMALGKRRAWTAFVHHSAIAKVARLVLVAINKYCLILKLR
jgi:hypothetical protein